jgi:hypothetical protein
MKLTWFGGTALRAYVGGRIVVIDPKAAPETVDRRELVAGADQVVSLAANDERPIDPDRWKPAVARPLDPEPELEVLTIGPSTLVISAPGEPPLLVADASDLPHLGRWVDGAVFVLFGERGVRLAEAIVALNLARPKLLALAADEKLVDELFDKLVQRHDPANLPNLSALEPGLALEV